LPNARWNTSFFGENYGTSRNGPARNPVPATAAGAGLIVVAIVAPSGATDRALHHSAEWCISPLTTAQRWFTDSINKFPPFKKDGKDAVRAYVYRDAEGKEFVSHMDAPEVRRARAALDALPPEQRGLEDPSTAADGVEVKRPKETTWLRASTPRGQQTMQALSPSGKTDGLTYVEPK
jgi:hypothetical protein